MTIIKWIFALLAVVYLIIGNVWNAACCAFLCYLIHRESQS